MAVNVCAVPSAIDGFAGVIVIERSAAGPTVKGAVVAVTPEAVAEMATVPWPTLLARPAAVPEATMFATAVLVVLQVAVVVTSCVLPSVNVPSAVNCWFCPRDQVVIVAGLMAIDFRIAAVTFTVTVPLTPPKAAVTVALPWAEPVTKP